MVLWLKALHVIFVTTWFAGLFYLPRLFVYHSEAGDAAGRARFCVMERKLFAIMTLGAALAIVFGAAMVALVPAYLSMRWLHAKLALVALLIAYHLWCGVLVADFARRTTAAQSGAAFAPPHDSRWFRWFNEAPALLLIAIVILAVVKP